MCSTTIRGSIYFILCFTVLFGTALGLYVTSPHIIVFMADDLVRFIIINESEDMYSYIIVIVFEKITRILNSKQYSNEIFNYSFFFVIIFRTFCECNIQT